MTPTYSFEQVISMIEDEGVYPNQLNSLIALVHSEKECYSKKDFSVMERAFDVEAKNLLESI